MPKLSKKQRVDAENALIVKREDYVGVLKKIIADGLCPFCEEHLSKYHTQPIIYKSKYWIVSKNAWPYEGTKFHFLLIVRPHVEAIEQLSPSMWTDLQKLHKKIVTDHNIQGASFLLRSGNTKFTGASVSHLHAHLITGSKRNKSTKNISTLVGFKK